MEELLKRYKIRNTAVRRAVLEFLDRSPHAVTHAQIEEQIGQSFDRVTLYRTLHAFEEQHLIHKILSDSGAWAYALCRDCVHEHEHKLSAEKAAHQHSHNHDHVHFKCETCQHTFCLQQTAIPVINLPSGYQAKDWQLLVTGVCEACGG
jgi:Fur family ferric uptake transcriptional regulator